VDASNCASTWPCRGLTTFTTVHLTDATHSFGASTLFRMGVTMRKVLGSVVYMAVSFARVPRVKPNTQVVRSLQTQPEVLEGNYTNACDLWSLGVIMVSWQWRLMDYFFYRVLIALVNSTCC